MSSRVLPLVLPRVLPSIAAAVVGMFLLLAPDQARAYPQWQLSTGAARCSQCHYAPAGGGLINSYGRDAAGEDLSTFGGNGALLHGAIRLPAWLAIGGDLRGALLSNDVQDPDGPTRAAFPMQADLGVRVAFGRGFSFYGTGGLRAVARGRDTLLPMESFQPVSASRLISREHWVMWQPEALGFYVRAGRFYAPYGLRMAEHIMYVRRDLGFNMLNETYNVSGGFLFEQSELHVTAFAPDFVRHIGSEEKGLAVYYEHRLLDARAAIAGQARVAVGPNATRSMLGVVAKAYADRLKTLFMAEANAVEMTFADSSLTSRSQLVAVAGFTVMPVRGVMATLLAERSQLDLSASNSGWNAATALVNWFPYAHIELQMMGRLQFPSGGESVKTLLAQLHYYF